MVEGARRAAKRTQSREEWWRGPVGQPNTLRAGRNCGGGQEDSQTHSEPGGVVEGARRAAKPTQSREEWWRGPVGQPNTLRAGRNCGGGQEDNQTHSEPGGVVEGGPGGQPNALRAGRGGGGLRLYDIITVSEPQSVHQFFHR